MTYKRLFTGTWVHPQAPPPNIAPVNFRLDPVTGVLTYDVPAPPGTYPTEARKFYLPADFDLSVTDEAIWNSGHTFAALPAMTEPATDVAITPPGDLTPLNYAVVVIAAWA